MRLCLIVVAGLLSACRLALPGQTADAVAVNPIIPGQIIVTPLDTPAADRQATVAGIAPATAADEPVADPATAETPAPAPAPSPAPAPAPAPASTPVDPPSKPKSAAQLACYKGGGAWVAAGTTGTMSCQKPQRDGGRQCRRDSDCAGQCLARSRTCAPYAPLFGCNEVLQDNGQRVTLCIE